MHRTSAFYGNDPKGVGEIFFLALRTNSELEISYAPVISRSIEEYPNNKIKHYAKTKSTRVGAACGSPRASIQTAGITLIALIITIILLLILAGITLHFTLGENGILKNAELAGNKYKEASENEENLLDQVYAYMNGEKKLKPNTPETLAGTPVEIPNEWYIQTPTIYLPEEKKEIEKTKRTANVYAVSDGKNNTIPIPVGFYYVGGNIDSGVVISDNEKDVNKYKDLADVPSGLKLNGNGELESELQGNQFVWIPCTEGEYKKETTDVYGASTEWDTEVDMIGIEQTRKYGGFYVGRYEAGLASDIEEYTTPQGLEVDIYDIANKKPQSKAGIVPWNYISYKTARINSIEMYKESNKAVTSGIITGTQWDVMIKKMAQSDNTKSLITSSSWGNYGNQSFKYLGRSALWKPTTTTANAFSSKTGINSEESKSKDEFLILTTGASERNKLYNLYDVAGNLWELTEETASFTNGKKQVVERGGAVCVEARETDTIKYGAGYRATCGSDYTCIFVGYRIVLYIK